MMKDFFKPKDFAYGMERRIDARSELTADIANGKLNALIESWPVVTGFQESEYKSWIMDSRPNIGSTHKARLAFLEEIVKEPCKHEPEITLGKDGIRVSWPVPFAENVFQEVFVKVKCKHCGVELEATWSENK